MTPSQRRQQILSAAADTGDIMEMTYSGGPVWVRAGNVDLGDEKDRGDQALYVDELRAMIRDGLVERRGKDYFKLTGAGFTAAKQARAGLNVQTMSTADLAEIVKQKAEAWQKPDQFVWNELMRRYSWVGCPKEDRRLIGALDAILRPLNNGYTCLPPGIIPVAGAPIPPPPPYYQGKVSLSEVIAKKTPSDPAAEKSNPVRPQAVSDPQNQNTPTADYQIWITGPFYLLAFLFAMVSIAAVTRMVSPWIVPVVVIGGLLALTIVGALQLRNDGKLADKSFLQLMRMALEKLPLLRNVFTRKSRKAETVTAPSSRT